MRIFFIFLLLPLKMFSQDIQGVWTGTIYNDTTKKYIPYEIVISESKGKLSGYSNTTFLDNNKEVTGVKSLKIKQKNSKILIEDADLIYNNYSEPPPKGVKQYNVLNIMQGESGLLLVGVFNTNQTKEYASLTGTIHLQKKENIRETKIIPKLDQLQLLSSLSFIQDEKEKEQIVIAEEKTQQETAMLLSKMQKQTASTANNDADAQPEIIAIKEDTIMYKGDVIKEDEISSDIKSKNSSPVSPKKQIVSVPESVRKQINAASQKQPLPVKKPIVAVAKDEKKTIPITQQKAVAVATPQIKKNPVVINQPVIKQKDNPISQPLINKKPEGTSLQQQSKITVAAPVQTPVHQQVSAPAQTISSEAIAARKIETIRTVNFKSDSLTLTLYDNGVVDGDTVSVILNGVVIMPKQGLSTKAITKTIYITPELGDSLQLIMYAENLGSIPPNTGLLIIQDGEDRYQIRFAGDLQKNSAILLKRTKSLLNNH